MTLPSKVLILFAVFFSVTQSFADGRWGTGSDCSHNYMPPISRSGMPNLFNLSGDANGTVCCTILVVTLRSNATKHCSNDNGKVLQRLDLNDTTSSEASMNGGCQFSGTFSCALPPRKRNR